MHLNDVVINDVVIEIHISTRGYATRGNMNFNDHSWNKIRSYTEINKYPLYLKRVNSRRNCATVQKVLIHF